METAAERINQTLRFMTFLQDLNQNFKNTEQKQYKIKV